MARSQDKPKKLVTFKLTYFKASGKYYSEGTEKWLVSLCTVDSKTVYMPDYISRIRQLREHRGQGDHLPGLNSLWLEGYVLIDCEDGVPHLLKPLKEEPRPEELPADWPRP